MLELLVHNVNMIERPAEIESKALRPFDMQTLSNYGVDVDASEICRSSLLAHFVRINFVPGPSHLYF